MGLDVEAYSDFEDELEAATRAGHKGYNRQGGSPHDTHEIQKVESEFEEVTPETRILNQIVKIELSVAELSEDKKNKSMQNYTEWVQNSLNFKMPEYNVEDVDTKINQNLVILTHKPTTYFAMDSSQQNVTANTKKAEYKLFNMLEKHIKDWQKASPEFKKKHGII